MAPDEQPRNSRNQSPRRHRESSGRHRGSPALNSRTVLFYPARACLSSGIGAIATRRSPDRETFDARLQQTAQPAGARVMRTTRAEGLVGAAGTASVGSAYGERRSLDAGVALPGPQVTLALDTNVLDLSVDHQLFMWDAVMVAAAAHARCRLLLSEDLQEGFTWGGVTVVNPFARVRHPLLARVMGA